MTLHSLNRAGFTQEVILAYQLTPKVKKMVEDIQNGDMMPPIVVYPSTTEKHTIADGIHRICAYLYLGILSFSHVIK